MKKILLLTVLLSTVCLASFAQRRITGKVTSASDGEGIPGVNILVKDAPGVGTATDIDGKYSIQVPEGKNTLQFSLIGMKTVERVIKTAILNVTMEDDIAALDEVVVNGFQKIDKRLFTGSAVRLDANSVKLEGVPDISRGLQGQVAGVDVGNVSSTFGAAPVITIRGNASINGANRPLWVVDGVVLEDAVELTAEELTSGDIKTILGSSTAGLNPEDIESFQVLKDASATALYGARAMNGVIVITTRRGAKGHISVEYTGGLTMRTKPSYSQFNLMNSAEEVAVYQEMYDKGFLNVASANRASQHGAFSNMMYQIAQKNINWGPDGGPNYDYLQRYANANTDWFDVLYKNSVTQQHSVSLTAGSDRSRVRASIGYMFDPGQTISERVSNYTAAIRGDFDLTKKLSVGMKLSANVRDQQLAATSQDRSFDPINAAYTRSFDINPFSYAMYTARSITPYDANGNREYMRVNYAPFNVLHEMEYNKYNMNLSDITLQADLAYKFKSNLQWRSSLQGRWYTSKGVQTVHEKSNNAAAYRADDPLFREYNQYLFTDPDRPTVEPYSVLPVGGFRKTNDNTLVNYFMRNTLEFNPTFGEGRMATFLLGQEMRYSDRTSDNMEGWGYLYDKGGFSMVESDFIRYLDQRGESYYTSKMTRNRSFGLFANAGYSYMDKYIANMTLRYDGDNRTGTSTTARYLPTWNVSGAWNIREEKFMESFKFLDLLKLKTTYGITGDNPLGADAQLIVYGSSVIRPYDKEAQQAIANLVNNELTYEKQYEWNIGLETAFLHNRIGAEVEYYRRHSKDLIGSVETNAVGGMKYKVGNVGEMKISGVDASLRFTAIQNREMRWNISTTYSYNKNEITNWVNNASIGAAVSRNGANLVGYPAGSLFSIPFAGLDSEGLPTFYGPDGEIIYNLNLQNRTDITKYLKYEGTVTPKVNGGLVNDFNYKNWQLNIGLVYRYGNKIRLDDAYYKQYDDQISLTGDLRNRWQLPGDENYTNIPVIATKEVVDQLYRVGIDPYRLYNKSDLRVADGGFLRLKSVKLGYRFPENLLAKTFLTGADVSLSAYNLWLIYSDRKLEGMDPEFYSAGGASAPPTRQYTLTFNLKF